MKHIRSYILLLLIMSASFNLFGNSGLRPRGDVNCDWKVNVSDVTALIQMVLNGTEYHSLYTYAADINNDKRIDVQDIVMVIDGIMNEGLPPMPSYSGTLPVLFINTEGYRDITSKEEYLHASWWLDNMGIDSVKSIGSAQAPLGMQIKGRGNSTWTNRDKKPYRLKFDEKVSILGMPANRHFILLANAGYWMGQMNDPLPFEIGRRMGMAWNPRIEPVEVVLNGQYIGLYFFTEKIRVDQERVNITEQKDKETDPNKITGGWILEIENYKEDAGIIFTEGNGQPFYVTLHSPEVLELHHQLPYPGQSSHLSTQQDASLVGTLH